MSILNRLQRFGSLGDVGANLVFALITGAAPNAGHGRPMKAGEHEVRPYLLFSAESLKPI